MAIITAEQVRDHFPQLDGTGEDSVLDTLVGRADGLLAQYFGMPRTDGAVWTLEQATYTRRLQGPDYTAPRRLRLGVKPVISVTSVHQDLDEEFGSSTEVVAADRELDAAEGILYSTPGASFGGWYRGNKGDRPIKVVLEGGWATAPEPLVAIVATQVRHLWELGMTQGVDAATGAGVSETRRGFDALIAPQVRGPAAPFILWGSRVG